MFYRKAVLPIEMELGKDEGQGGSESDDEAEGVDDYMHKLTSFRMP